MIGGCQQCQEARQRLVQAFSHGNVSASLKEIAQAAELFKADAAAFKAKLIERPLQNWFKAR